MWKFPYEVIVDGFVRLRGPLRGVVIRVLIRGGYGAYNGHEVGKGVKHCTIDGLLFIC